nr:GNAT family N-acetyltransferase [Hyphomonas sp. Mor2]
MSSHLRPARIEELVALSALCLRSKAHWGYDDAFMAACVQELTLTPLDLETDQIIVLEDTGGLAGLAQVGLDRGDCYLDKLFIEPRQMGLGYGKQLYDWALQTARDLGASELIIEADPDAAPFYEIMGAVRAGEVPSGSVAGRMLPRLVHPL